MRCPPALRMGLSLALWAGAASVVSAAAIDDAIGLFKQKRYTEARTALEQIVQSEPSNASACYFLGLTLQRVPSPSLDAARSWLERAVSLSPDSEPYLAEYAGATLLIADRDHSIAFALEGRDAMTKAISMDPDDLDAYDGLMEFYAKAPWPLGDSDKAMDLAGQIAKRDAKSGEAAFNKIAGIFEKAGRDDVALSARQSAQKLAQQRSQ
jgi:tetratricopeptide (TPR) repeat protein